MTTLLATVEDPSSSIRGVVAGISAIASASTGILGLSFTRRRRALERQDSATEKQRLDDQLRLIDNETTQAYVAARDPESGEQLRLQHEYNEEAARYASTRLHHIERVEHRAERAFKYSAFSGILGTVMLIGGGAYAILQGVDTGGVVALCGALPAVLSGVSFSAIEK